MISTRSHRIDAPQVLIVAGGGLFIFVLWLSAYWEPDIRWLHFQAWMYVAAMSLSLRGSRWGYFVGISAAAFWNYSNLFVNTFFLNGLYWLAAWITSDELKRADQILPMPGWMGNLLMVTGCVWGICEAEGKAEGRQSASPTGFRHDARVLRRRRGSLPTTVPAALSPGS